MFASAAAPSLVFFVALLRIPESPRWLIGRGCQLEAFGVLKRVGGELAARRELLAIGASLAKESGCFRDLLGKDLRRPLRIAAALAVLSQVTGINTVIYYGSILLKEHAGNSTASSALGANTIIGLTNFLCTIPATLAIDKVGRKALLLFGSAGMGVSLTMLAMALGISPPPGNLIVGLLLAYVAFFAVSLGPGTWGVHYRAISDGGARTRYVSCYAEPVASLFGRNPLVSHVGQDSHSGGSVLGIQRTLLPYLRICVVLGSGNQAAFAGRDSIALAAARAEEIAHY
jgi:hypothetical protein